MRTMKQWLILCLLLLNVLWLQAYSTSIAQESYELPVETPQQVVKNYTDRQKTIFHLNLAILYVKHNKWDDFLENLKNAYKYYPPLKENAIHTQGNNYSYIQSLNDLLPEDVTAKLSQIGLKNMYSKKSLLEFLEIAKFFAVQTEQDDKQNLINDCK